MKLYTLLIGGLLLLAACTEETQEGRSMEQIHQEDGVPVQTTIIQPAEFITENSYLGTLSGIYETSVHAAIGGEVETVHVKVGDRVEKDDLLVSFPLDSPAAGFIQAKAAFDNAKAALGRLKSLYESGGISRQDLDNAQTGFDVSKANLDAVSKMVRVLAPISGTVVKVSVQPTNNVDDRAHLVTIADLSRIKTRFGVPEKDRSAIQSGMQADIVVNGEKHSGSITQVDMTLDMMSRTFGVMAEFDNRDRDLVSGSTVEINIQTYRNPTGISIERKHLLGNTADPYVFIADDGKSRRMPVETGRSQGSRVEILSGLSKGMELIVSGLHVLDDGSTIQRVK